MNSILAIIWEWRFVIVLAIAFILYSIFNPSKLYAVMLQAKSLAKDKVLKSGEDQENWVLENAYRFVPYARFVPTPVMKRIIHWLYHKAKDKLDDGKLNDSI